MILEHSKETPKQYRWVTNENEPVSEWFEKIEDALEWIIEHDKARDAIQPWWTDSPKISTYREYKGE